MLTHWRKAELVSVETVLDSKRVCLASREVVIGSQGTLSQQRLASKSSQRASAYADLTVFAHM